MPTAKPTRNTPNTIDQAILRIPTLCVGMRKIARQLCLACCVSAVLLLTACAGGEPARAPDPERGRVLFNAPVTGDRGEVQPCVRCHAVEKDKKSVTGLGTNFYDLGARAGQTVPGQSAEDYLRVSIVDPDAHLAGGFQDGLMYRGYAKALSAQEIDDLVAYMLTLK
jgi:cytochrome c553